jgi:nucleoside-diphosphate-sugar epimerase
MVWAYEHGNTPRRRPARRADVFCDEDAELRPQNLYAETKVRCEQMLAASQVPSCVMRIATIHGHADAGETRQSVHRMIHQAAGGTVHLFAPDNWRPFIHLGDAAQALQRAIDHPDLEAPITLPMITRHSVRLPGVLPKRSMPPSRWTPHGPTRAPTASTQPPPPP